MGSEWKRLPLASALRFRKPDVAVDASATYDFAGVYSFGRGVFRSQSRTGSEFSYRLVTRLQHGELVYLKVGAWEGAFGVVPPECDGCVVSPEFPVFVINSELLLPRFLELLLGVPAVWKSLSGGSTGTNARRRRLHPNDLLKCSVLAPSLEEQRAIVAHVDAVQGAVREAQKIRTNVESELGALLMSAYQSISEGAPRMPLGEVAPVVRREVSIDPESTYTELGVRSFYKGTFQRRTVVGAEFSWQDLYRVKKGDLVFSNIMAWEKAIAVAKPEDDDCVGNHRMLTCEARSDCAVPSFLWYYFTTPDGFEKVHAASPGTAARNRTLTAKALQAIPVPVPTVDRQRWFDRLFAEVDHARRLQKAAAEEQSQLVPSLVQRLFAPGIHGATAS
ncbi:hypothetical protein [Hyalangium sp.]|uniref:hypothetical protein n=1 Tax=Hyalangium sp. TaxID=2028555 RepID=UPI002D5A12AC|nr:hypothetical protein [Hyalangium sp.]HYH96727.1 hypothetical protein [Hyalangium sp.]